tara:strand:+ start:53 stop:682 length:630 start_codon:yes stop_codon:yes gene_type:complete
MATRLNEQGIAAVGSIVGGLAQGIGGMIGQRRRKKEQRDARAAYDQRLQEFENLDTSNLYGNLTNPFEDATVNTQAAEFTAQQQQQGLASTMSAMSGAAGGSGIAALAQSMANVQGQQAQRASADIARQEQANQQMMMQQAVQNQQLSAMGAGQARNLQFQQVSALAQADARRQAIADQAVNQAREAMIGGIGDVVGGVTGLALGGIEK